MYIEIINIPTPNIITGCYHRHLKKSSNGMFIEKLKDIYIPNKLLKNNKHVIICDKFNYNLLNFEHNKFIGNYLNTLNSNLLQSCTIEPTRKVDKQKLTFIDNIFSIFFNKETQFLKKW